MLSIVSSGIGSGIDIQDLVSQLVASERAPAQTRLDRREADAHAKISAFGLLKSALATFQASLDKLEGTSAFDARSATSADTKVFSASATVSASPGSYDLEVTQLAKAHKLISAGYASAGTTVGTGTMTVSLGTKSFALVIDDTSKTLAGVRDAVNAATDNPGVTATIINVDDGSGGTESKLVMSSDVTGVANAIKVTVVETGSPGLAQLVYDPPSTTNLTQIDAPLDAIIKIDGQAATRSSNTISDALDGVTLSLHAKSDVASPIVALTVALDTSVGSAAVDGFVTSFNALVDTFNQIASYDAVTGIATTLLGDATVRSVESLLRRELGRDVSAAGGSSTRVAIGISTGVDGKLSIDRTKLDAALATNPNSVRDLFGASDGLALRLGAALAGYTGSGGIIDSRTDGLDGRLTSIGEQRADLDIRTATLEQRLQAQFIAMDLLVGQLRSTSDFLTDQLALLQNLNLQNGG